MLDNSWRWRALGLGSGLLALLLACDPNLAAEVPDPEPVARTPDPVVPVDGEASRNLLQAYIDRDPEIVEWKSVEDPATGEPTRVPVTWREEAQQWKLPFQAKRIVVALIIAAAHDRLENLDFILTPDAQWGWPDPRRPQARPIFDGDGGERFFAALRTVAARLPADVDWVSKPVPPGIQMLHLTGAEPMWTFYAQGYDGILMQLVMQGGVARISYVGVYEELPDQRPSLTAYGPMPPLVPPRRPVIGPDGAPARPGGSAGSPAPAHGTRPTPPAGRGAPSQ